jgi:predicted RND superfamily exporter protein
VERLRQALVPPPTTLADLPPEIARRMLAPDGHARVQVFPRENVGDTPALVRFVDGVRGIAPDATGVAVNILEFGRATVHSFSQALLLALVAIALLVWGIWRRAGETLLVLVPLVLSGLLTVGTMVALGMPFNFANVIVLPLLLGMGVDSGIHLVHLSRAVGADETALLDSTTARAVLYSALTTIVSFGNLALSHHRGLASMGVLLVCGMLLMLACNLVVLPALIVLRARRAAGRP